MNKIVEFKIIKDYMVWIKFEDGFSAELDFEPFLGNGFTKELLEEDKFKTLSLEDGGGLTFYNGFDFCPNYLRLLANKKENVQFA
jgi:hypothetical protein